MEPALHHAMMAAACSFLPRHQFAARTDSHLSNCRTALSKRTQTPENLDDSDLFAAALPSYVQTSDPNLFIVNSDVFLTIAQHIADPDPLLMDLWPLARDLVLEAAELSMQSDDTVLRLYERAQKIFGRRKFIDYRQYAWSMFPFDPAFESPDLSIFRLRSWVGPSSGDCFGFRGRSRVSVAMSGENLWDQCFPKSRIFFAQMPFAITPKDYYVLHTQIHPIETATYLRPSNTSFVNYWSILLNVVHRLRQKKVPFWPGLCSRANDLIISFKLDRSST